MLTKKQKGSALVFALIMLSIMLVIAAGSFSASVTNQRTSNDTTKSVSAFQAADSGVEKVLKIINEHVENGGALMTLSAAGLCNAGGSTFEDSTLNGRKITVEFYLAGDVRVNDCSTAIINDLDYVKSVGEFGGTVRAVSVEVKNPGCPANVSDNDGNTYATITIGNQCWMAENIRTTKYPNGSGITPYNAATWNSGVSYSCPPNATNSGEDCPAATTGAAKLGYLYQWRAAMNGVSTEGAQGICPSDWHIPTDDEYKELNEYFSTVGCDNSSGAVFQCSPAGTELGTSGSSGFEALYAGSRTEAGALQERNSSVFFWTSTRHDATRAYERLLSSVETGEQRDYKSYGMAMSVRCIKD